MWIVRFFLDEEAPGKNIDYMEGMIGLFHLRLAVMHMIMRYVLSDRGQPLRSAYID